MSVPVVAFFNSKSGVGKTSLVYHLAWMFSRLQKKVVAADIDPQANLTAAFLTEEAIDKIWNEPGGNTIYQCVKPLTEAGDIPEPKLQDIEENLYLLPGDAALSSFEDQLSNEWPGSMNTANLYRPLRILSAFWQAAQIAAAGVQAEIVLVDIGPNLGAINRSVLIAADYVVIPVGADLFSLQGLKNLGPALKDWKALWSKRLENWRDSKDRKDHPELLLPGGTMRPIGYLCRQYGVRPGPVRAYDKWARRIPGVYREAVLGETPGEDIEPEDDPNCISVIKHYRSLVPIAQEHRKPVFDLTPADGAIGSHANAVFSAKGDFEKLSREIIKRIGLDI
ncbi:MAG: AAA family ATPase [Treponema sp.]|jgi:cellulose biosynthesis protein BcsQ|nr:AAA family ATPase [Treponema sp.]